MDITEITYTDDQGEQRNALDYLMADGNLGVPGGRYGSDTSDCAPIAIMLFMVFVDANGEDSVDLLDGMMSMVVNGSDEVCWTVLDNLHVFMDRGGWQYALTYNGSTASPFDWFDNEEIEYARELYTVAYCGETPSF